MLPRYQISEGQRGLAEALLESDGEVTLGAAPAGLRIKIATDAPGRTNGPEAIEGKSWDCLNFPRLPGQRVLDGPMLLKQLVGFLTVGAVGTAAHYLVLIVAVEWAFMSPVLASVLGFTVGAFINYFLNYQFTFKSSKAHREAFIKFGAVALLGAGLNTGIMYLSVTIFGINYLFSQFAATMSVVTFTFAGNRFWTFCE